MDGLFDHLADGLILVQLGLLVQHTDRIARREDHLAAVALVFTGDDTQQGAFTGAIQTQYTDLGAVIKPQ